MSLLKNSLKVRQPKKKFLKNTLKKLKLKKNTLKVNQTKQEFYQKTTQKPTSKRDLIVSVAPWRDTQKNTRKPIYKKQLPHTMKQKKALKSDQNDF